MAHNFSTKNKRIKIIISTHAIAGGVDAKTLSGILGHANASFTLLSELANVPKEVAEEYRKEAVKNVRRTRGKINLDDLISRNNREFAEQKLAENNSDYDE